MSRAEPGKRAGAEQPPGQRSEKMRCRTAKKHYPLAFRLLLENYFKGTTPQKRRSLSTLVQVMVQDPEALSPFMGLLKYFREEDASTILLKLAEEMDVAHQNGWRDKEALRRQKLNATRFYESAGSLVRVFRRRRLSGAAGLQGTDDRSARKGNAWSYERVREELIRILRENRCVRKYAAQSLLTSSVNLRIRIFPRYRIDEKEVQREWIQEVMMEHPGNIAAAAQALGISPQTLRKRLQRYGMPVPPSRPGRSRKIKTVDRAPVAQYFREMYRATVATATPNRRCRAFCLRFFQNVERWFAGRFNTDEERRAVFRLLRVSERKNRLRIQYLYQDVLGRSIPFDIREATRYKFCHGLLQEILGKKTPGPEIRPSSRPSEDPGRKGLVLALQVWALRHWTRFPLHWREYRRSVTVSGAGEEEVPNSRLQSMCLTGPTRVFPR